MKTFDEIRNEVIQDIKRGEMMGVDKKHSFADIERQSAKEYAKQWVQYALESSHEVHVTALVEMFNKEIDAQ